MAILPGDPGLASCLLDSPSPFNPVFQTCAFSRDRPTHFTASLTASYCSFTDMRRE